MRMHTTSTIYKAREAYSLKRLNDLGKTISRLEEVQFFPSLTIFGAGSYGRLEASKYSDIDLFFLRAGSQENLVDPRTHSMRLFGKVISVLDDLGFPKLSNDCEYLALLHTDDIVSNLGGRIDDHANYFTARMLLLLESRCLYGEKAFDDVTARIVTSYFKDFPDHPSTFHPMFLLNDICRYWKTLLLNYENKRQFHIDGRENRSLKTKQKVRNFKLKYSRMTTCFATIAALGSHPAPVTQNDVIKLTRLTPRQRLESIASQVSATKATVAVVLAEYSWFLEMTELPTEDLEEHFRGKRQRIKMFQRANNYGDAMYKLIQAIDGERPDLRLLRTLVI